MKDDEAYATYLAIMVMFLVGYVIIAKTLEASRAIETTTMDRNGR